MPGILSARPPCDGKGRCEQQARGDILNDWREKEAKSEANAHCATCYADGIQMATGCTFSKGNIQKLGYGKFALTLIDRKSGKSVRVVTRPETIQKSRESKFIGYRKKGVPASQIEPALVDPMIDMLMSAPAEQLFIIHPIGETKLPAPRAHNFNTQICTECGEVMVERYARIKDGKVVCMVCAAKA